MGDYVNDFRHLINLMEFQAAVPEPVAPAPEPEVMDESVSIEERLEDIVFKLRSHSSSSEGDMALGEEAGCEMAAEMIENLLRQMGDQTK